MLTLRIIEIIIRLESGKIGGANLEVNSVLTLTIIVFSSLTVFSQEEIDIRSIGVNRYQRGMTSSVTITAINSQGKEVIYRDGDAITLPGEIGAERCYSCYGPKLFTTNIFDGKKLFIFELNSHQDHYLRFYKMSSDSSPLYISQRDMIRRSAFIKSGFIKLAGRVEVFDNNLNRIIAYDDDVVLEGNYSIGFGKPYFDYPNYPNLSRVIDQSGIVTYLLSETRELNSATK